jgi:hypothetical protein
MGTACFYAVNKQLMYDVDNVPHLVSMVRMSSILLPPPHPMTLWCAKDFSTARIISPNYGNTFRTRPDRPWGLHSILYNGYRVVPGVKRPRCGVDHLPHLVPSLKKSTAIPLLPLWAFVVCSRVKFNSTFTFTSNF